MTAGKMRRRALQGMGVAVVTTLTLLLTNLSGAPMPDAPGPAASTASTAAAAPTPPAPAGKSPEPRPTAGQAQSTAPRDEFVSVWDLPAGSLVMNPVSGRREVMDPEVARSAVLFGDSQAAGAQGVQAGDTWVVRGLAAQGYKVRFVGAGGIGFTAKTTQSGNYVDSLVTGQITLPFGNPALVVVQGGGNDAGSGASDAAILANAERLLRELKASYPTSKYLLIGTLARGTKESARRTSVDALLAGFAQRNGVAFIGAGDWLTRYGLLNKMADGVHLNRSGHQELSKALATHLNQRGLRAPARKK